MPEIDPKRLPFDKAIAYFRDKLQIPSDRWDVIWNEIADYAFAISGVTRADLLNDLYQAISQALEQGTTLQQFVKDFDTIAERRGWADGKGMGAYRKELIFSQNLRTAYAAGRYQQMTDSDVVKSRPYWVWKHRDSRNPRPAHLALHNKVFSFDDPFWQTGYPPCGFGCRCAVYALNDLDLQRRGLKVEDAPSETVTIRDRMTGQSQRVPAINGQPVAEPGFAHAPGSSPKEQRQAILDKALDRLPDALRKQVVSEWRNSGS